MSKYRTVSQAVEDHTRLYALPGEREKILYAASYDANGHMELKVAGRENLYQFIQSHKDSCDIHVILARFAAGDVSALSRRQMFYADITEFPTTYADVINTMHGAQEYFTRLPVEVRAQFGHDFNRFLASLDDPAQLENLKNSFSQSAPPAPTPDSPAPKGAVAPGPEPGASDRQ